MSFFNNIPFGFVNSFTKNVCASGSTPSGHSFFPLNSGEASNIGVKAALRVSGVKAGISPLCMHEFQQTSVGLCLQQ